MIRPRQAPHLLSPCRAGLGALSLLSLVTRSSRRYCHYVTTMWQLSNPLSSTTVASVSSDSLLIPVDSGAQGDGRERRQRLSPQSPLLRSTRSLPRYATAVVHTQLIHCNQVGQTVATIPQCRRGIPLSTQRGSGLGSVQSSSAACFIPCWPGARYRLPPLPSAQPSRAAPARSHLPRLSQHAAH
jgi:hypothetical protein